MLQQTASYLVMEPLVDNGKVIAGYTVMSTQNQTDMFMHRRATEFDNQQNESLARPTVIGPVLKHIVTGQKYVQTQSGLSPVEAWVN